MPYAVTHILVVIILIEIFREYFVKDKKQFPRYYILIAAIGAIIPDLDIAAFYILYFFGFTVEQIHRTFSHSIYVPLILFGVGILISKTKIKNKELRKKHMKLPTIFFIFAFGSLVHLILDSLSGTITPLNPLSDFSINFNIFSLFPKAWEELILPTLDGILLFVWIIWREFFIRKK